MRRLECLHCGSTLIDVLWKQGDGFEVIRCLNCNQAWEEDITERRKHVSVRSRTGED